MKQETIKGYKGFNKNLKCRGLQYEVGKTYETNHAKACEHGFHFCENPLDILEYYPPCDVNGLNRFCEVEGSGEIDRGNSDSKVACSKIKIGAEIKLDGLIKAGVKFILDKVKWENKDCNTGNYSAATNTGDYSAATNTGNYSAATNTGNYSAATNTGYRSAAIVNGKDSIAIVTGKNSKAKGSLGCWIVLTERGRWNGETYPILDVKAFKVDGVKIKADTFYMLVNGELKEVE